MLNPSSATLFSMALPVSLLMPIVSPLESHQPSYICLPHCPLLRDQGVSKACGKLHFGISSQHQAAPHRDPTALKGVARQCWHVAMLNILYVFLEPKRPSSYVLPHHLAVRYLMNQVSSKDQRICTRDTCRNAYMYPMSLEPL